MRCYSLRRMIKGFEETGSLEAKPLSGRPSTCKSVAVTVLHNAEAIETLSTYGEEIGGEGFDDFGEHDIEELLVDEALNDDDILESMVDTTKDFETVDSELEDVTPLDEKLLREGLQLSEFSAWLLKLGNGELTNDLGLDSDTFEIPSEMVCNGDLVKEIYGDKLLPSDFEQYTDKAILCPRNVDVDDINNRVLDILEGDSITYFSSDSIDDATPEDNESYPPVFLNSLNPSGMPLHKLKL
ncbi:hypothetical protein LAZ67_X000215 [Cordylochernes scorpioides]|uniref:ATP-dependent DNA helicase n=1 Tax=Cordylochernes scorpioides TaxID=51811 RepID=A0ABY6LUK3_9ARAC|nr:hypothetical protein LAZ67_X000215 [Cordylochernes scorpioides]